jgi:hypothetical protein
MEERKCTSADHKKSAIKCNGNKIMVIDRGFKQDFAKHRFILEYKKKEKNG